MKLPDSYEDLFSQAMEAFELRRREEAAALLKRLVGRLQSLPAHILERKPELREMLMRSAGRYVAVLRWSGQNEEALAAIESFGATYPDMKHVWTVERALNLIDSGRADEGLDLLRALVAQDSGGANWEIRGILMTELGAVGLYEEAERVGETALRNLPDDKSRMEAFAWILENAIESGNVKAAIRCTDAIAKQRRLARMDTYEWLAGSGRWEELERQIAKGHLFDLTRRVFIGEIQRARGDETGARETWQSILQEVEEEEDVVSYARASAELLLGQASKETADALLAVLDKVPADSTALLMFVAASAQLGRIEDARAAIQQYMELSRLFRPYYRVLPRSYWVRLRRYPMPDEAVETLRPYFATGPAEGSA